MLAETSTSYCDIGREQWTLCGASGELPDEVVFRTGLQAEQEMLLRKSASV